jgi:hypothetical protein
VKTPGAHDHFRNLELLLLQIKTFHRGARREETRVDFLFLCVLRALCGSCSFPAKRKAARRPPFFRILIGGLDGLYVLRLPALGALDYIELDLLTFLQAAEAVWLDGGEVNENVLAVLAADETIALGIVKPLYCSCFHGVAFVPLLLKCALKLVG